ncbi:MAG: Xaa-Pro peptidase family protein [Planctomycetota bacterium]
MISLCRDEPEGALVAGGLRRDDNAKANTMTDRIARLRDTVETGKFDAMLITDETNVRYLSGFTGDSSWLLIDATEAMILSDRRYETQIAAECPTLTAAIRPPDQKLPELLAEQLSHHSAQTIGFEAAHVSVSMLQTWQQSQPNVQWVETSGVVEALRAIKDGSEIGRIRRAVTVAQRAFTSVTHQWNPRMTERDIAFGLESAMRSMGASGVSFTPIVGVQPNGALPHYEPGDVALGQCDSLLIDWGACVDGYCSDLTRTLHRADGDGPMMSRFRSAYAAVLDAQEAAITTIRDGVDAREVDAAARQLLTAAGYGEAFKHGLGHGFGLQIHEDPRMSPMSEGPLKSGMVVTVEPGVYFEGEFGIRIEDDLLVTEQGCERLSCLPKGLDDCLLVM